ncbi:MAG: NAD-dependent epimerase/dehydratase family protein [Planctomycetota bacterium]|jgi:2'-hydroxyisoflavone reductase
MSVSRRHFLQASALGGASLLGNGLLHGSTPAPGQEPATASSGNGRKLLILGGTRFLGPHLVDAATASGWEVTLVNRGRSNPEAFPGLEKLVGDRDNDLKALEGRKWDAVIDTSGYIPRHVKMTAELLAENVGQYVFISTISVYDDPGGQYLDEQSPVGKLEDETMEQVTGESYGPLKALCEQAAEAAMPGRVSNIRPGLIVGPLDNSGRFTYWPWRVAQGGEVLAPGAPDAGVEFIDARDLAQFSMHCIEQGVTGVYNANGPGPRLSMQELLHGCKVVLGADASFTWIPDQELMDLEVGPWIEMPLWIPASIPNSRNNSDKAIAAGMRYRPSGDTIRDTYAWAKDVLEHPRTLGNSLKAEKEAEVLKKWHEREQ